MGEPRSIVFFDVDGTLTFFDPENQSDKVTEPALSPSVPEAFKRLQANGHLAVI